jgi:DNA-binding ferritin-like protein
MLPGRTQLAMPFMESMPPMPEAPQDLAPEGDDCFCQQLVLLAAMSHEVQMAAHLLHFNYVGANFFSVHEFLKGEYEYWLETFDLIGEYVRAYGSMMPASHAELLAIQPAFVGSMSNAECALTRYRDDTLRLKELVVAIEAAAADLRAIDVQNSMAEIVAHIGKSAWFIQAALC